MRLVRGCGVSCAASCYLRTFVRALLIVTIMVRCSRRAVKRSYVPERVVAFSQGNVLARNTPKPNSTVGSWNALRTSKVGCGIGATQDTVLPSSLYSNLIGSRVQID